MDSFTLPSTVKHAKNKPFSLTATALNRNPVPRSLVQSLFAMPSGLFLLRLSVLGSQVTVVGWDFTQAHVRMSFEKGVDLPPILRATRHSTCSNSALAVIGRELRGGLQPTN